MPDVHAHLDPHRLRFLPLMPNPRNFQRGAPVSTWTAPGDRWDYFEVRDPGGRLRLETLREGHAIAFARAIFGDSGETPDIVAIERARRIET